MSEILKKLKAMSDELPDSVFDQEYKEFWEKVKDNECWSGGMVNLEWDELWPSAKLDIIQIYDEVKRNGKQA